MTHFAQLSATDLTIAVLAVFLAGVVRGFTGFALSALIMAGLAVLIPPVQLIPICTLLELCASGLLLKGGFGEADKRMVFLLQSGALLGVPTGLYLTNTLNPETSKMLALVLIVALAFMQLAKVRLPLSTAPLPTVLTGVFSGFVTGLASIGGMVIALYTLALNMSPKEIRGSLILQIFVGGTITLLWQLLYGMITPVALSRFALLFLPAMAGVLLGRALFTPRFERYYRPTCLILLIGLGLAGLLRTAL